MSAVKLNLSFEVDAAELIRNRAKELGKPVSRYLADLAEADARAARDRIAAEGYRVLSADMRELVATALPLSAETWPEWQETDEP